MTIGHPVEKAFLELFWFYLAYDTGNHIVNRDPMIEISVLSKPVKSLFPKLFDIFPAIGTSNNGANSEQ